MDYYRVYKGGTRSLDYGSLESAKVVPFQGWRGSCQNDGLALGTPNIQDRVILGIQKWTEF